jgi:UDP-N-acetylmuramyl pentapeptide phosphotransferase/UDP-N-acetylglucosamine-1-phosphate transferase
MVSGQQVTALTLFFLAAIVSAAGVGIYRLFGQRFNLVDRPNERSSHSVPVVRGAGIVIVGIGLVGYALIVFLWQAHFSWGYFAGILMIAGISVIDDVRSVPPLPRLLVHLIASVIVIVDLGYWHSIFLPVVHQNLDLGGIGALFTVIWIVGVINAYNFMDGIDGIAGLQGVVVSVGWCFVSAMLWIDGLTLYGSVLAGSCFGFLIHNWQPAKVFLGDVGSSFLGFTFAVFPLLVKAESPAALPFLPWIAIGFLWVFLFDTTTTRLIRLTKNHKIWSAHREHIYQRLVIGGAPHWVVSSLYGFLSVAMGAIAIIPLTYDTVSEPVSAIAVLIVTATPIIFLLMQKRIDLST